jgi:Glycosyl hydrolases family 35
LKRALSKRFGAIMLALFAAAARPSAEIVPAAFVQAVQFQYDLCPPNLWERELVRLKNIGIETIEFSVSSTWHQVAPGDFDFTGRTNPRRDLAGFIRILRRVGLQAWVGTGDGSSKPLEAILAPQTVSHGGPIAWTESPLPGVDAAAPPLPVHRIAAGDPAALPQSREVFATARGALLWTGAVDALYPGGWLHEGVLGFNGEERGAAALRRDAMLLRAWAPLLPAMQPAPAPKPASGKFPEGVTAALLVSNAASAVSIVNRGTQAFQDDIHATDSKRAIVIPGVSVAPGESLWLPVGVSLSQKALCRECSNFSPVEQILYASAELVSIEYENGILAMEFAAPQRASVVLQLERQPVGPFLASGKPTQFEWDEKTLRARLPIPAGAAPDRHVRIAIAIEEPETSAFFDDARRLIIGAKNVVSTTYSSPDVAARSRLRLPEGYTAEKIVRAPNQIDYEIAVPASAADGDYANFALEVDGVALGRARLQLFPPIAIRFAGAIALHFGPRDTLLTDPPVIPIDPKAGTNIEVTLRNNWPAIRTYKLEASGEGLEFFPPKTEITIGPAGERKIDLRVFGAQGAAALREGRLRVTGGATLDLPMRVVAVPHVGTVAWAADLDDDGSLEWILESAQARAVFSTQDGGRWMEFTWKDGGLNFLPDQGMFAAADPVEVRKTGDTLEFIGKGWTRTARLDGAVLTVAQNPALPPDSLKAAKRGNVSLTISRESAGRVKYALTR